MILEQLCCLVDIRDYLYLDLSGLLCEIYVRYKKKMDIKEKSNQSKKNLDRCKKKFRLKINLLKCRVILRYICEDS